LELEVRPIAVRRNGFENADLTQLLGLLRVCGERPSSNTGNDGKKIAPSHAKPPRLDGL
jgi:hypothetical protein